MNIGELCYIGFGRRLLPGDYDITVIGKDVVVPSHTAVGHKCKVLPKVGPSDFRASLVPSGTVVLSSSITPGRTREAHNHKVKEV